MNPNFFMYIARILAVFLVMPLHESAHAYVAYKLGDSTAKSLGRLTLNPMKHLDIMGCISLLILGVGWAKPVPINPNNFAKPKQGMAISSLAGPVSNFLLAVISMVLFKIAYWSYYANSNSQILYYAALILQTLVYINIALAIFNMIPVPPFDGSRVLFFFLPDKAYMAVMKYERYVFLVVFALLFLGVLDKPLSFANNALFNGIDNVTRFIDIGMLKLITVA